MGIFFKTNFLPFGWRFSKSRISFPIVYALKCVRWSISKSNDNSNNLNWFPTEMNSIIWQKFLMHWHKTSWNRHLSFSSKARCLHSLRDGKNWKLWFFGSNYSSSIVFHKFFSPLFLMRNKTCGKQIHLWIMPDFAGPP